jgi:hypothetical protein
MIEDHAHGCPNGHGFRPGDWYPLGQLRRVAAEIIRARQVDPKLSAMMRAQNPKELPWAKSWNEELYPLKVLADHKSWSDDDRFCWTSDGAADFKIRTAGAEIKIQCTMAYPEWAGSVGTQGGHVRKLELIQSNKVGHSFPGGGVYEPRARGPCDDVEACRRGITKALENKLKPDDAGKYTGCHLLIFALRFRFHTIDFDFRQVIVPTTEQVAIWKREFERLYVCDDDPLAFVEPRRNASLDERQSHP